MEHQISFLGPFNFSKTEEWNSWIMLFEKHLSVVMNDKTEFEKIECLFYTMGYGSKNIFKEILANCDKGTSYEKIKNEVQSFLKNKKHTAMERWKFVNRLVLPNETIDSFIEDLLKLLTKCDYGPYEHVLLREHIIVCIQQKYPFHLLQKSHISDIENHSTNNEQLKEMEEKLGNEICHTIDKFLEEKYQHLAIAKELKTEQSMYVKQSYEETFKNFFYKNNRKSSKELNNQSRQRRKGVKYNEPLFSLNGAVRLTCMYGNNLRVKHCDCTLK